MPYRVHEIEGGDHSLKVPKSFEPITDTTVQAQMRSAAISFVNDRIVSGTDDEDGGKGGRKSLDICGTQKRRRVSRKTDVSAKQNLGMEEKTENASET